MQTPDKKPDLIKTGAALSLAGCNLIIALPLLLLAGLMMWCAFSIWFR